MDQTVLMVVGSLNRGPGCRGAGLSVFALDTDRGSADLLCEEGGIDNPSFLSVDPRRSFVYANSEVSGRPEGTVSAYRFDRATRRLHLVNEQPSLGALPAHSSLDTRSGRLLVANYGDGPRGAGPDRAVAVFPLRPDGGLDRPTGSAAPDGRGPDAARQDRSHPHCALPSPDGRFIVVADLGLDAILTYGVAATGELSPGPVSILRMAPGAGPRHLAFHPSGHTAVVIGELDSQLTSLRFDGETGRFQPLGSVPAVPEAARRGNVCSDVQIHPDGRFVYGANRGHDSIVVLAMDAGTGRLSLVARHACGGRTPRHLAITPDGRVLVVANQGSDTLSCFAIDPRHGTLSRAAADIRVGTPMCVKFMGRGSA